MTALCPPPAARLFRPGIPGAPAFTLVELMVVLVIVGVLAALSLPLYERVVQGSRAASCIGNLRQIGAALSLYVGEHNMVMPTMSAGRSDKEEKLPVLDNTLNLQLPDPRVFACPGDNRGIAAKTGTSYFWNSALNGQNIATLNFFNVADVTHIPVLSDKEAFHPYQPLQVNILYADGHATRELKFSPNK